MRRISQILLLLITINTLTCCSDNEDVDKDYLTLVGNVISEPNEAPLSNITVNVKNSNRIIASTTTNTQGRFELEVSIAELNMSSKLYIEDVVHKVQKEYEVLGFGNRYFDYGDIVLYDSRNPYNLPLFKFNNHTYLIHPLLTEEYTYEGSLNICSQLHDYDVDSWFLPTKDELMGYFKSCNNLGEIYSAGYYRISQPNTSVIRIYRLFIDNVFHGYGCDEVTVSPEEPAYVLPLAKYQ